MAVFNPETKKFYCECGCGLQIHFYNKYAPGHNLRTEEHAAILSRTHLGSTHETDPKTALKISKGLRRFYASKEGEEAKERLSRLHMVPQSEEHRQHNSESKKAYWAALSEERKEELLNSSFHSKEARRKSKESTQLYWDNITPEERRQFRINVSKAGGGLLAGWLEMSPEEQVEALREAYLITEEMQEEGNESRIRTLTGTPRKAFSEAHLEHLSEARRLNWQDPEYVENQRASRGLKPNMTEELLGQFLEQFFPGVWEYTGDFGFSVGGKIPDFTDRVGKRVIESMGEYRHDPEDEENKIAHYRQYGYDCIVVWANCRDDIIVQWPEIAKRLYEGSTYRVEKKGGPTRVLRL